MATSEERIALKLETLEVNTKGIDLAISKLEALDALVAKPRHISIRADVSQLRTVYEELANLRRLADLPGKMPGSIFSKSLVTQLRGGGLATEADRMAQGFADAHRELEALNSLLAKVQAQRKALSSNRVGNASALESLELAHGLITRRTQEIVATEIEAFQKSEEGLGKAAKSTTTAISAQERATAQKIETTRQMAREIDKLTDAEKRLGREEKKRTTAAGEASATPPSGARIRQRRRNGELQSEVYAEGPGRTREVSYGLERVEVEQIDRIKKARHETKLLTDELKALVNSQKASGANFNTIGQTYDDFADKLEGLAKSYSDLEAAGATSIGQIAQQVRASGMVATSNRALNQIGNTYRALLTEMRGKIDRRKAMGASPAEIAGIYRDYAKYIEAYVPKLQQFDKARAFAAEKVAGALRARADGVVATSGARELRSRYNTLNSEMRSTIERRKLEGASVEEIAGIYRRFAGEIDQVAKAYEQFDRIGSQAMRNVAERQRSRAAGLITAEGAKQEAEYLKQAGREYKAFRSRIDADRKRNAAENLIMGLGTHGFTPISETTTKDASGRRAVTTVYQRETAAMREQVKVHAELDAAGRVVNARTAETSRVMKQTADSSRYLTKNFLTNTASVTTWAASVAVLYGTLNTLRHGIDATIEMQRKQALLTIVFGQGEAASKRLSDEAVKLAVAYGRSGSEAQDAAIRFARLGLTQSQVLEAVRASLLAANVAEIDTATAADQLAAVMATFNLEAKDLAATVNKLNAISNNYNVTNKDMLSGLGRVGSLAKQTGLGLEETMGAIASIVARTGRSGAEAGNALKAIAVALANPALQKTLDQEFGIEVRSDTGQINSLSDILRELYIRYQELTDAERQYLLQQVAGKRQASRLQALIDGYVDSQINAVRALTDLSSAEQENKAVKATLMAQIQGLVTAYERLWFNLSQEGGSVALLRVLTQMITLLKNTLNLMAEYSGATAIAAGAVALFAGRVGLTAVRVAVLTRNAGFLANTMHAVQSAMASTRAAITRTNRELILGGASTMGFTRNLIKMGGVVRAAGIAFAWLTGTVRALLRAAWPLLVIGAAVEGINWLVERNSDGWEKAQQNLAGFNDELERLKSLGEAGQLSARLVDTVIARLKSGKVAAEDVRKYIEGVANVAEANDASGVTRAENVRGTLNGALESGGRQGLINALVDLRKRMLGQAADFSNQFAAMQAEALDTARAALDRLQQRRAAESNPEKRRELDAKIREAQEEITRRSTGQLKAILGDVDEDEAGGADDPVVDIAKRIEDQSNARLEVIKSVFDSFSSLGAADSADLDEARISMQMRAIDQMLEAKREELDLRVRNTEAAAKEAEKIAAATPDVAELAKARDRMAELFAEQKRLQDRIKADENKRFRSIGGFTADMVTPEMIAARERLAEVEFEILQVRAKARRLSETPGVLESEAARNEALAAAEAAVQSRIDELEAARKVSEEDLANLEAELRKNEEMRRGVEILQAQADAKRTAGFSTVFRTGRSEAESNLRELRALQAEREIFDRNTGLPLNLSAARWNLETFRSTGNAIEEARALETMRTFALRQEELLFQQLQRYFDLQVEITKERRKQNEEASKAIQFGDRETQIRAALAERFRQQGGQLTAEQFSYLSPETRRSIAETNPNVLPPELNGLTELNDEFSIAAASVSSFVSALEEARSRVPEADRIPQTFDSRLIAQGEANTAQINSITSSVMRAQSGFFNAIYAKFGELATLLSKHETQIRSLRIDGFRGVVNRAASGV